MFKKAPSVCGLRNLVEDCQKNQRGIEKPNGKTIWVPARPIGYGGLKSRSKIAWGVFTGKYDALKWPEGQ